MYKLGYEIKLIPVNLLCRSGFTKISFCRSVFL